MTQEVSSSDGSVPVLIQIWDSDDNILDDDDDQGDINPLAGNYTLGLDVNLTTGRWSGDINWPQNCVEGHDERDVRVCFEHQCGYPRVGMRMKTACSIAGSRTALMPTAMGPSM